uniref:Putative ovule protein n=1 Tax=Solanum chacoense TaxID=4108 RepID=A0A0V0I3D7_SOLCH
MLIISIPLPYILSIIVITINPLFSLYILPPSFIPFSTIIIPINSIPVSNLILPSLMHLFIVIFLSPPLLPIIALTFIPSTPLLLIILQVTTFTLMSSPLLSPIIPFIVIINLGFLFSALPLIIIIHLFIFSPSIPPIIVVLILIFSLHIHPFTTIFIFISPLTPRIILFIITTIPISMFSSLPSCSPIIPIFILTIIITLTAFNSPPSFLPILLFINIINLLFLFSALPLIIPFIIILLIPIFSPPLHPFTTISMFISPRIILFIITAIPISTFGSSSRPPTLAIIIALTAFSSPPSLPPILPITISFSILVLFPLYFPAILILGFVPSPTVPILTQIPLHNLKLRLQLQIQ